MHNSIVLKILSTYVLILIISFSFFSFMFTNISRQYVQNQQDKDLHSDAETLTDFLLNNMTDYQFRKQDDSTAYENKLKKRINRYVRTVKSNFAILNHFERPLYLSSSANKDKDEYFNYIKPIIKETYLKAANKTIVCDINGKEYIFFIIKITAELSIDLENGYIVLYTPTAPADTLIHKLFQAVIIAVLISLIVIFISGLIFARTITKPIIQLKTRAERIAVRDFDYSVRIESNNELGQLSEAIDCMAVSLKEFDKTQRKFLQNASHELKTPLMSIQGYAEGIKDNIFEDNNKALDTIVNESTRLKKIVENLVLISKLENFDDSYNMESISSNRFLTECTEKFKGTLHNTLLKLSVETTKDATIYGDKDKLTQAIINILSNAVRYAETKIEITGKKVNMSYVITVYNDGEQFAINEAGNIFTRFFKGNRGQTGLGLSITKVIIDKHNGNIIAENAPQGGVIFTITLPAKS